MCRIYSNTLPPEAIRDIVAAMTGRQMNLPIFEPSHAVRWLARRPNTLVIRPFGQGFTAEIQRFGFRPAWMTDEWLKSRRRQPPPNARNDRLFDKKSMWLRHVRKDRCVIVADGLYEPRGPKGQRDRQHYFLWLGRGEESHDQRRAMLLAGLWTERKLDEDLVDRATGNHPGGRRDGAQLRHSHV